MTPDQRKLQLLESRFWDTNESGGHPEEVERGWRAPNHDASGLHRRSMPVGTDLEKLAAEDLRLEEEVRRSLAGFEQKLRWLREIAKDDPEASNSFLVKASLPAVEGDLKILSVETDVAPDLVRAMIFKGL